MRSFICAICFCISSLSLSALDASISYATFKGQETNYIEMYLYVVGSTVEFKSLDSLSMQSNLEITYIFKKGEDIIKFDKYELNSPTNKEAMDFIDLKRYNMENGDYSLEVKIIDLNKPANIKELTADRILIDYNDSKLNMSDIQLLSSCTPSEENSPFVKNGLMMESVPFNFYNKNLNKLIFCTEIYGADVHIEDDYMISYIIEKISNLTKEKAPIMGHKRRTAKAKDVFIQPVDISGLASGNYKLKVEIRNREKELITNKAVLFQRSNPYRQESPEEQTEFDLNNTFVSKLSYDELRYSLKAIAPKMNGADNEILNMIIKSQNAEKMRSQLFAYWANKRSLNPKAAYDKYMEVARAVDNKFKSGFGHGFETDRGYIFMKYGKPTNMITVENEAEAPPYEIWFYDTFPFTDQTNVRFLFYNPSLASGHFLLLHSTARGEVNNPLWVQTLYSDALEDAADNNDFNNSGVVRDGASNRNAARYFNDF